MKIDREIDFHHYTRAEMLTALENAWASRVWHGCMRIRIIHGTGEVLWHEVRDWCDDKGIPWAPEPRNPGATILFPSKQARTSPAPAHKPLAKEKAKLVMPVKRREAKKPVCEPAVGDMELFAAEVDRLNDVDPRVLRRKKISNRE